MEILRRSYDIDGASVEMIFDEVRRRYTIASRWANLAHIPMIGLRRHAKRTAHERASAVFEVVCLNGAEPAVAKAARSIAMKLHLGQFSCPAYMERELIRRFTAAHQPTNPPRRPRRPIDQRVRPVARSRGLTKTTSRVHSTGHLV